MNVLQLLHLTRIASSWAEIFGSNLPCQITIPSLADLVTNLNVREFILDLLHVIGQHSDTCNLTPDTSMEPARDVSPA